MTGQNIVLVKFGYSNKVSTARLHEDRRLPRPQMAAVTMPGAPRAEGWMGGRPGGLLDSRDAPDGHFMAEMPPTERKVGEASSKVASLFRGLSILIATSTTE